MSVKRLSGDRFVIPQGLLPYAKDQSRIRFCDDDRYIVELCARAIEEFEQHSGMQIHPGSWQWKFSLADWGCCPSDPARMLCRFSPVTTMTVIDGATPPIDVTASYAITTDTISGVEINYLEGPAGAGTATLSVGYATADAIPPGIRDKLVKLAAHRYEYREILIPGAAGDLREQSADELAGYVIPRL
jgi:hypothetical protein